MMKIRTTFPVWSVLQLFLLLLQSACSSDEETSLQFQKGYLAIGAVCTDYSIISESATRSINKDPNAPLQSEFIIEVVDCYGSVIKSGPLTDFSTPFLLFESTYTIRAYFGSAETQVSDKPYYYGETSIEVKANETVFAAPITATLQCAMVSADISGITDHFQTTPKVYVNSPSSKVELTKNQWLYLKPNENFTLSLEGTNLAGIAVNPTLKTWIPTKKMAYSITVTPDLPIITLPDQQPGTWAKKLYITPATATNSQGTPISLPKGIVYEVIPASSSDWSTVLTSSTNANGLHVITGLNSNSSYKVRARLGTISSNERIMTTETEAEVPNGDFEEINQTINISSINQGGKWSSLSYWTAQQTKTSITIYEPKDWASVNAKTCCTSANTQNTWFMVPSTLNSGDTYSNSNAVILRNVAWDLNGSTPGRSTHTDKTNYSTNAPNDIANRSAGKLFLGNYSFNSSNASEIYSEGISFSSRPSKLQGWYKYTRDNNDNSESGLIRISLLDESNMTICYGTLQLDPVTNYTKFTLIIPYNDYYSKAKTIKLMISSSNHLGDISTETSEIKTTNYMSESEQLSRGAQLTIDNLTFTYD